MKNLKTLVAKAIFPQLSVGMVALTAWLFCPLPTCAQGGVPIWTNAYRGPNWGVAVGPKISIDRAGKVFVAAMPEGGGYATIAYSNDGLPLWTNRYTGPLSSNYFDNISAIATDNNGNVFVTGTSDGIGSGPDYATIAYSNAGAPLWTNRYNGVGTNLWDQAVGIAADTNGNVYVTGSSETSAFVRDYVTIKYSNLGVPVWTNRYNGPANSDDVAAALALDNSGNVFVTGSSGGAYVTVAYSNSGVSLWTNRYKGPSGNSSASAIAVDNSGNVMVTGSSYAASGYADYATIAYSNVGLPLWTNRYDGPLSRGDSASAIAVDNTGNVFVAGSSATYLDSVTDYADFATIKYSKEGIPLWTNLYDGPTSQDDAATAIAVDNGGNVFVTGASRNNLISESPPSWDYATIGYSNSGGPLWTNRYNEQNGIYSWAYALAVDGAGSVFVTGYTRGADDHAWYTTIKYSSSLPPVVHLDFQRLNNQLVLSWTNAGFNLQSAPFASGNFTNIPGATSPYSNSLTASRQFFRLAQ